MNGMKVNSNVLYCNGTVSSVTVCITVFYYQYSTNSYIWHMTSVLGKVNWDEY